MAPSRLVVGLGNPGPSYKGTRHNVGRDFIEYLAEKEKLSFREKGQAEIFRLALLPSEDVVFAKLDTFMNSSGQGLQSLFSSEKFEKLQTLIISDDFMLPFGALRLRPQGSSGGHNGLKSIIDTFGTDEFARMRVGVGPVPPSIDPAEFVLDRFTTAERGKFDDLYAAILNSLKIYLSDGIERAMSAVNKAHFS